MVIPLFFNRVFESIIPSLNDESFDGIWSGSYDLTKIRSSRTLPPTPTKKSSDIRGAGEFAFDGNI